MAACTQKNTPCYCTALRKAARAVTHLYDTALEPGGLRVTQFSLLRNVQRLEPVPLAALSETVQLDRTTLIRNLDILAKQGLLAMRPNPPSRANLICLTEKGREVIEKNNPLWDGVQETMEEVLTEEERRLLRSILKKLQNV